MKVYIHPTAKQVNPDTGIGQVVIAQAKHLPEFGVKIVDNPHVADIIACHVSKGPMPRVDVLHSHGIYFADIPHVGYSTWHAEVNRQVADSARAAFITTVPSEWVTKVFKRDMRITPEVVGHGIDADEWKPGRNKSYALWNKTRCDDVCDAKPAYYLAQKGISVFSTFLPEGEKNTLSNYTVTGILKHERMKKIISEAGVYIATTMETFGIGTLEALACGVPVLGYAWGGTLDLIQHKVNGYLVEPGDMDALVEGYYWLMSNRAEMTLQCQKTAKKYTWSNAVEKYVQIYQTALTLKKLAKNSVSVVIPCYNYSRYIKKCVESVQSQTKKVDEIIVVDDGSTDDTEAVVKTLPGVKYIKQSNMGVAFARNTGVAAATGEFIACIDPDDYMDKNFVKVLGDALARDRSLGVVYSNISVFSDANPKPAMLTAHEFDWDIMSIPESPPPNCIPIGSLYRRSMWEAVGGYRQVYHPAEDTDFWVRGIALGFGAKKVSNDSLFNYNVHPGSASRTKKYKRIDTYKPWMRDKDYPFAAPGPWRLGRSYAFPLVSIIVPVGPGHANYLPSAIESVEGQTFREWELVVIDDSGSNEVDPFIKTYPFMHVVKTNRVGAGAARNAGIDAAKGDMVLFLDADDYLDPEAIEKMVLKYIETGCYVYTSWVGIDENGELHQTKMNEYNQQDMLVPGQGHAVTVLMEIEQSRRIRFDEKLPSFEDVEFFLHCAVEGVCGTLLDEPMLYYQLKSGKRRPKADEERQKLQNEVYGRYTDYVKGVKKMAGCCGGKGKSIQKAKALMGAMPKSFTEIQQTEEGVNMSAMVRMEFIGEEVGTRTFFGKYRGGNNASNKFADVSPSDVDLMRSTGKWRVVPVETRKVTMRVETPVERLPKEVRQPPEIGEVEKKIQAQVNLESAKSDFDKMMEEEQQSQFAELEKMKLYELVEYAEKNGIQVDRKALKTKAAVLEFVKSRL